MQQNELLLKENELFMTFLQRNGCLDDEEEPADMPLKGKGRKSACFSAATPLPILSAHLLTLFGATSFIASYALNNIQMHVFAGIKEKPQTLTLAQRHEIAAKETEQLGNDLKELEKRTQRETESLKAVIEETEIRTSEIRKEIYDFNRVLGGEENIRSKKFDADKICKFFDDALAHKEQLLMKLLEKNAAARGQIAKVCGGWMWHAHAECFVCICAGVSCAFLCVWVCMHVPCLRF
jgi:hypothetical protein